MKCVTENVFELNIIATTQQIVFYVTDSLPSRLNPFDRVMGKGRPYASPPSDSFSVINFIRRKCKVPNFEFELNLLESG